MSLLSQFKTDQTNADTLDGNDSSYFTNNLWLTKTGAYTAVSFDKIFANTASNPFSITLPQTPSIGDVIEFIDAVGTHDTNNLTVLSNSNNIEGVVQDVVFDVKNSHIVLRYVNASIGWRINN